MTYACAKERWMQRVLRHCLLVLLWVPVIAMAASQVLVESGSAMRYLVNRSDPGLGNTWMAEDFNDSAWSSGSYGVGYENDAGTPGAGKLLQTTVPADTLSVYTRTNFTLADVPAINTLFLGLDYDDGVIAWINGVEVYRSASMLPGSPDWNTALASRHESSNGTLPDYTPLVNITAAARPVLHSGTNVLVIGVWNADLPSSDLVLVPRLSINEAGVGRGPYLQSGAPTSVVVKWRTSLATSSRVQFGNASDNLAASRQNAALVTDHEVILLGLTPDTRYYYSIGTLNGVLAGGNADYFFVTSPLTGTARPIRLWVLGDSGTSSTGAEKVANAYINFTADKHTDLWLMLGDNAYIAGEDSEYQASVFDIYPSILRTSVLWSTLGNHDAYSADTASQRGVYFDIFTLPTGGEAGGLASGTEAYYSFDYGNIHFICLDSFDADRLVGGAMLGWLEQDLAQTNQEWIIAYWHHPPYSRSTHNSDKETALIEMRENVLPILEAGGVDLVLSGHSHSYERSFLLNGHYGSSDTLTAAMKVDDGDGRPTGDGAYKRVFNEADPYAGTVYTVAGSSSKVDLGKSGTLDHPAMYLSLAELGSLVLDVDGNRLDATFVGDTGAIRDTFTIRKNPDNCPAVANPEQLDSDGNGTGDACDTGDEDNDGLTNMAEFALGTDPNNADTDGDTLPDGYEFDYGLNPLGAADANEDLDGDGLTNREEFVAGTDPTDRADAPTYLKGTIKTLGAEDICALVLTSGRFSFSCGPNGVFSLIGLPREQNGTLKRQIYADGFFPRIDVLPDSLDEAVVMTRSGTCPQYNPPTDPGLFPGSAGNRIDISGSVKVGKNGDPVCALVLANGQFMFSCDDTGSYALNIPLDANGLFKLQVYADGFAPTIQTFDLTRAANEVRMARAVECQ